MATVRRKDVLLKTKLDRHTDLVLSVRFNRNQRNIVIKKRKYWH